MTRISTLLGVFVAVFVLTVGAVAVGSFAFADETPEQADINTSQWNLDNVSPDGADEGGTVAMESNEPTNTVVVHVGTATSTGSGGLEVPLGGTDEAVTSGSAAGRERSLGTLLSALVANGHEIEFYSQSSGGGSFGESSGLAGDLADADAFVTTDPASLSSDDRESVVTFAEAGGRVFVGADPGQAEAVIEIGSENGIYQEVGYLYNVVKNDQNYLSVFAEPAGSSELTDGVNRVVFRGAAPIAQSGAGPELVTGSNTELTTTQQTEEYGVAAVDGNLSVIGDTSFMSPENAYSADNNVLIGNVADFLVTGTVNETVFSDRENEQSQPGGGGF